MEEREFILDLDKLSHYIDEGQKDPEWVDGELTMFRDNCINCFKNELGILEKCIIIIDDSTRDVTINGQSNLQDKFNTLPTGYDMDDKDKIYRQVILAMDQAKSSGIYDQIFKEKRN